MVGRQLFKFFHCYIISEQSLNMIKNALSVIHGLYSAMTVLKVYELSKDIICSELDMAVHIRLQCPCTECEVETEELEQQVAIKILEPHFRTNHENMSKPEKLKRPLLPMPNELIQS